MKKTLILLAFIFILAVPLVANASLIDIFHSTFDSVLTDPIENTPNEILPCGLRGYCGGSCAGGGHCESITTTGGQIECVCATGEIDIADCYTSPQGDPGKKDCCVDAGCLAYDEENNTCIFCNEETKCFDNTGCKASLCCVKDGNGESACGECTNDSTGDECKTKDDCPTVSDEYEYKDGKCFKTTHTPFCQQGDCGFSPITDPIEKPEGQSEEEFGEACHKAHYGLKDLEKILEEAP